MNRTTKWIAGGTLAVAVLAGGVGVAVAADVFDDDDRLTGETLEDASAAALAEAGGGRVIEAEADDGRYDLEVLRDDGSSVEITLDRDLQVLRTDEDRDDDRRGDRDLLDDDDRDDDLRVDDARWTQASAAALASTGDGTVTDVDRHRDGTYDVEVTLADGREVDVLLAADLTVVSTRQDD